MNFIGSSETTKYQGKQDVVKKKKILKKLKFKRLWFYCKNLLLFVVFLINDFTIYNSMNSITVKRYFSFKPLIKQLSI